MTALTPASAIDQEAIYREWARQYEWHIDQIPALLETLVQMLQPTIRASVTDKILITGGGYRDNVPVTDRGRPGLYDAISLWFALREYVKAVGMLAGECPAPGRHGALWSGTTGIGDVTPAVAREVGFTATAWLADRLPALAGWNQLSPLEEELFHLIRRTRARYRDTSTVRRARPRLCTTCGEVAVNVDWVDAGNGSPKPVQVGRCRRCGATYMQKITEPEEQTA